jgi:hypothetical protein
MMGSFDLAFTKIKPSNFEHSQIRVCVFVVTIRSITKASIGNFVGTPREHNLEK